MVSAVGVSCRKARTITKAAIDLPTMMIRTATSTGRKSFTRIIGSNSIPTATKNSTAKASRNGSVSLAARWLSSDSLITMPAKKAPSAKETPNRVAAAKATPSAIASTARRNSSRDPVCATVCRIHGIDAPADDQHQRDEGDDFAHRDRKRRQQLERRLHLRSLKNGARAGSMHQRQHHCEVFHDQPADRDAPALGLEESALLQGAQQHHRARDRQRQTEHKPAADRPAERGRKSGPHCGRDCDLNDRAGYRDVFDRQQVLQ